MRRWLLLVLVLLLPLRAWVGDAMAGEMLQQRAAAGHHAVAASHAAEPMAAHAHAGHDCDHHAQSAPAQGDEATSQAPDDCPTCAACQACSSLALSPAPVHNDVLAPAQPRPDTVQRAHASAEPLLAFKPPRA